MQHLNISCHLDCWTGFGQQNIGIIRGLLERNVQPRVFATGICERFAALPADIRSTLVQQPHTGRQLYIGGPRRSGYTPEDTLQLISWEAPGWPQDWLQNANKSPGILFWNDWNASCFSAAGGTAPVTIIPPFIPGRYSYRPPAYSHGNRPYVFGAAGKGYAGQAERKNLQAVVAAFIAAFPSNDNVRLKLKISPLEDPPEIQDPRIEITARYLTDEEMQDWYASCDVFVHVAGAESIGFQPMQAMATGRPLIATRHSGLLSYFRDDCGIVVPHYYGPAKGRYSQYGHWTYPDFFSLVKALQLAYNEQEAFAMVGRQASIWVKKNTIQTTTQRLIETLTEKEAVW